MAWFNRSRIAIIIGGLNLITYLVVCVVLVENLKYDRYSDYDYDDYRDVYKSYELREQARVQREFYCMIYVTMCIIQMLLSVLLMWGVVKKRPGYISPWLLGSFVVLIYSSIVILDDIFIKSSFQGVAIAVIFFIILFAVFGYQIFCLAMVYSVYTSFVLEIALQRFQQQTKERFEERLSDRGRITGGKRQRGLESTEYRSLEEDVHQLKSKTKKSKTYQRSSNKSK